MLGSLCCLELGLKNGARGKHGEAQGCRPSLPDALGYSPAQSHTEGRAPPLSL